MHILTCVKKKIENISKAQNGYSPTAAKTFFWVWIQWGGHGILVMFLIVVFVPIRVISHHFSGQDVVGNLSSEDKDYNKTHFL